MSSSDGSPAITWAISFPVIGPRLIPIIAWPVAMLRLLKDRVRPMYGSPSGEHGRKPHQGTMPVKSAGVNCG